MSNRYQAAIITASYNGLLAPNAPTIGTATAGAGSASVAFTAPSNVGGSAITSYTAISSPGGITGTAASSPVTVSGLTNGTAYTFTVVATNSYGPSASSAASNSVTPAVNYIEEVFQTWLYAGNNATQTITNGIDLSGKGGMVWTKSRTSNPSNHGVIDTVRGNRNSIYPNLTGAQDLAPDNTWGITGFNSTGYGVGTSYSFSINNTGENYVSWTFREQPKFFDIVTFTGNGAAGQAINHNLGSTPGCILVKRTSTSGDWASYHRSLGATQIIFLNDSQAAGATVQAWNNTEPTSTQFTVGVGYNASGSTYVAYLFAHNAGGFGLTGADNVISCGSFTTSGTGQPNATVNLGYEPQWIMYKRSDATGDWRMQDNMRGLLGSWTGNSRFLRANTSDAESQNAVISITPTGFLADSSSDAQTYIYIAIRRGPMKVPTTGTSVFKPVARTGTNAAATVTGVGFPVDFGIFNIRSNAGYSNGVLDRLRGVTQQLVTSQTNAEQTRTGNIGVSSFASNDGLSLIADDYGFSNENGPTYIEWLFGRAPGFADQVCWTSTDTYPQVLNHNLTVAPELIIRKPRSIADEWAVGFNFQASSYQKMALNTTATATSYGSYSSGEFPGKPTATQFTDAGSASGRTFVAYLFATVAGVSKVGSYTGTGALQTVDCGFTTGARFVLIKRTNSTGDWFTYDSARGITSGNDPYLLLNSQAAEVTNTNYVDTTGVGFQVTAAAPAGLNASGGTYIVLAIA